MGASAKSLYRLMDLHQRGLLRSGGAIVELGTQQLYCAANPEVVRDTLRYFARHDPALRGAESYSDKEVRAFADEGLFGGLLAACGFTYRALDIFEAENTLQFDLNLHTPGEALRGKFDLVTNFGTTEHLINQLQAMKTMHELAKVGGLLYHDLPLSGYHMHGYFSYNPLLFEHLAGANRYEIVLQHYSRAGAPTPAPRAMTSNGYPEAGYFDCGIEFIFRRTTADPFRMPLETGTSLGLNRSLWGKDSPYAMSVPTGAGGAAGGGPGWNAVKFARRAARRLARMLGLR